MEKEKQPEKAPGLSGALIESERLILRPTSNHDAQDIYREFNDNVTTFLTRGPNESLKATHDFISRSIEATKNGEKLQLTVTDRNDEFLGLTSIERADSQTPELGLWLKEAAQGNGYGPELIFALVDWANNNLDFDYLIFRADAENVGSWKIAEKLLKKYKGEFVGEKPEILRGLERITRTYHILPEAL